eukprot:GFUD01106628.1.p1 GENE.GFUD01106628.1~~GFUD01106628.1.p1  ORF type:complete len:287 (-),score=67.29 GFUD01106628.1:8-847(-)
MSTPAVAGLLLLLLVCVLGKPVFQAELGDNEEVEDPPILPEILSGVPEYFNSHNESPREVIESSHYDQEHMDNQYNPAGGVQEHMGSHYQPVDMARQQWASMQGYGHGGFYQQHVAEGVGRRHRGHSHGRHHRQQASHQHQHNQDHNNVKNINNTSSQAENENHFGGHKNAYNDHDNHNHGLDHHEGHAHAQYDYNRHDQGLHGHDHHNHQNYAMESPTNSSLPFPQYTGYASTFGSWLSGLWPFNHHGQQHGGLAETLPEIGQDAAQEVPEEHLVSTP